jgi:acetyl/propionyl-CoA carboxylase alpha subunit
MYSAPAIEIQVFGDTQGNVYLHARLLLCSAAIRRCWKKPRRPVLAGASTWRSGGGCRPGGRTTRGTVQFIVETLSGLGIRAFYFMETKTRWKEHPRPASPGWDWWAWIARGQWPALVAAAASAAS